MGQNGLMSPQEIKKALVVIVWQAEPGDPNKKVLLLKLIPKRGGFWQPVTGGVDAGESYAEGALREAQEETGLEFDRQPQYLGLESEFITRHGPKARERAFYLPLMRGSQPPTLRLDGREHEEYEWVSAEEALKRVKFPANAEAIRRAAMGVPPLLLNRRGAFFQEGEEITHDKTASLFHRSLVREKDGHFTVRCEGESLDVILDDNPRYVLSYDRAKGEISLTDGTREMLNPKSILIRDDNSLTCKIGNGWEATFLPSAYYEIAKDISESGPGKHVLHFLGRDHKLRIAR